MFKHNIDPSQIPFLVRLTADLFRTASKEVTDLGASKYTAKNMHFIADMFKDLVNTAYPLATGGVVSKETQEKIGVFQGQDIHVIQMGEFSKDSFDKTMEDIAKIMKDYKPPKKGGA